MGILEIKLRDQKLKRILRNKFDGFMQVNNFCMHRAERILILWNPSKVSLDVMKIHPQIIHCKATCNVTSFTFLVSFVYGFHTMVNRRPLWNIIMELNENVSLPWLILGDYNNVLKFDEKCNGVDVIPYEIKDFANCCLNVGLTDVRSIGFFTRGLMGRFGAKLLGQWSMIFECKMGHLLKQISFLLDAFPITPHALSRYMTVLVQQRVLSIF